MSSNEDDKRIFSIIRPYCVALSRLAIAPASVFDPNSIETKDALKDVYVNLSESVIPETILSMDLADYVFIPLAHLLKQPELGDSQTTYLLKILALLIRHSWSQPSTIPYLLAKQLFPLITFLTGGSPNPKDSTEIKSKSTELKISGAETLNELFKSLYNQKEAKIYDFFANVENLPALGHSVTVLLELSHNGESISLQAQSLTALDTLYFKLINDGEILSYILPGNISTLTKIISSSNVNYKIIVQSSQLMMNLLVLVYNDEELQTDLKELQNIEEINTDDFQLDQIILKDVTFKRVHRTQSWLKGTSNQVKLALENVKKIQTHSKFEVREQLFELSKMVLSNCFFALNSSLPVLIEILAYLSQDFRLKATIDDLHFIKDPKHKSIFEKALSKELNTRVEAFSSVIQSSNESKIISTIGSLEFSLRNSSNDFLTSKLIDTAFIELTDLINKSTRVKHITSTTSDIPSLMMIANEMTSSELKPKSLTVYDRVLTKDIQLQLSKLFQTLGETNSDISEHIEELLSKENVTMVDKGVILWISTNLAQGHINKIEPKVIANEFLQFDDDDNDERNNLQLQMHPDFIYSLIEYAKTALDDISEAAPDEIVVQLNSNALDSIGIVANFLGKDFKDELVDYLYPVIDSLASSSDDVRQHALNTAMIISDRIYSGSLYNLILDNSDYLVDAISMRLSSTVTSRTTSILAVCVKIAGFKIIENFKDVLEIIFSLIDFYHGYADICIGFFVLFEIIIDEISKKYLYDEELGKIEYPENTSSFTPWGMTNIGQLILLIDKANKDILIESESSQEEEIEEINRDSDDEDDEINEPKVEVEEWLSPVPKDTYQLLQQIVYYGERLLTHPSAKLHVQILKTYYKALPIFATQINNLFPVASSIWPILAHLVTSNDPKIVIPAAKVISQLIGYTNTFLTKRFIELWSKLRTNQLLVSTSKQLHSSTKRIVLPGLESKCFESLVNMLMIAIERQGRTIPDAVIEEIIRVCIGVIPDITRFGIYQDAAWIIKTEIYGLQDELITPQDVSIGPTVYKFAIM